MKLQEQPGPCTGEGSGSSSLLLRSFLATGSSLSLSTWSGPRLLSPLAQTPPSPLPSFRGLLGTLLPPPPPLNGQAPRLAGPWKPYNSLGIPRGPEAVGPQGLPKGTQ